MRGLRFRRTEPRQRALRYLKGLLGNVPRKNGWQLAEHGGETTPDGMQRLLNTACWDEEAVRDQVRDYVVAELGESDAVLIVDETGFLKKGTHSAGVKRQYSGTAGRIENSQVGVFLSYASRRGAALIDRALYVPQEWAADTARRQEAGVPDHLAFQTKPMLAWTLLERALDAGVPCRWVTGDQVYGRDRSLRFRLEQRRQAFVLAVACNEPLWADGPVHHEAQALTAALGRAAWRTYDVGADTKGPRRYQLPWRPLWRWQPFPEDRAWGHWLLVRRSLCNPGEVAYYVAFAPRRGMTLKKLAQVAAQRWHIEIGFELAKQECGLDQYEVRRWRAWRRHVTPALLGQALLVALLARAAEKGGAQSDGLECRGDSPPAEPTRVDDPARHRRDPGLVRMAMTASGARKILSLPGAWRLPMICGCSTKAPLALKPGTPHECTISPGAGRRLNYAMRNASTTNA